MKAPQGFRLDPNSGLYYSEKPSKDSVTGVPVRLVTWFDSKTGISKQSSYPVSEPQPSKQDTGGEVTAPSASAASEAAAPSIPKSKPAPIPSGFALDPQSKLYYRSEQGVNGSGTPICRVTYYDPVRRTYHAVDYPVKQAPAAQAQQPLPAPPEPQPDFSDINTTLQQEQYRPVHKKKAILPIAAACASVLLVAALGICAWQFGWFGKDGTPTPSTPGNNQESSSTAESTTPSGSAKERPSQLDEGYTHVSYDKSEITTVKFPDGENFEMTYYYEGESHTVKGTYLLGNEKLLCSSEDEAPGWSGRVAFQILEGGYLYVMGPEGVGNLQIKDTLLSDNGYQPPS